MLAGRKRRARRGSVLVTYAMLFFALLGIAAVVIDLGTARLTQTLMQSAADTAAVEGLRSRNPDDGTWPAPPTPADVVAVAFDDDLDPANGDAVGYGAGPVYGLSGGVGDPELAAGQHLTVDPNDRVYKPRLALNPGNAPNGDVVAGTYTPDPDWTGPAENPDYSRNDGFAPAAGGGPADSLLVRLRRTGERDALAREAGVSTSGPPIPFLFGRGSLIRPASTGYNPRVHGITVRATAIAQAVPAKTVGLASSVSSPNGPGTATVLGLPTNALAVRADYWGLSNYWQTGTPTNPADNPLTVTLSGGVLTITDPNRLATPPNPTLPDPTVLGRVIGLGQVTDPTTSQPRSRWHVGDAVPGPTTNAPAVGPNVYTVLYATIDGQDVVVGFGMFTVTPGTGTLTLTRQVGDLGRVNDPTTFRSVSGAVLQRPDSNLPTGAALDRVFGANAGLAGVVDLQGRPVALLSPVLVR